MWLIGFYQNAVPICWYYSYEYSQLGINSAPDRSVGLSPDKKNIFHALHLP